MTQMLNINLVMKTNDKVNSLDQDKHKTKKIFKFSKK